MMLRLIKADRSYDAKGPNLVQERIPWRTLVKKLRPSASPCPADRYALDFLDLTLKLHVSDRITAETALEHAFLKNIKLGGGSV